MDEIIVLESGGYTAKINATRGANCFSLEHSGHNAKILREPDYSKPLDNPFLYGAPILFPQNRISGGKFEFEGRVYDFGINEENTNCYIHGALHVTPFAVVEKRENFVRLVYENDGTYVGYRDKFAITCTYFLSENGLETECKIDNFSANNLPVLLGFHTTFNLPFIMSSNKNNVKIGVDIGDEIERNMAVYLPTGKILEYDQVSSAIKSGEFVSDKPISRHYKINADGLITLYDESKNVTLVYENDEKYKFRLVYNGNADNFICIEPQTGMANTPNSPFGRTYAGFDFIKSGESKIYKSKIYIKEGKIK
ncbi:MAG: aldose 1-epimerase [Clostridia bacterium]|nr:aldose 1-epimerase [Clostridia bacterium]